MKSLVTPHLETQQSVDAPIWAIPSSGDPPSLSRRGLRALLRSRARRARFPTFKCSPRFPTFVGALSCDSGDASWKRKFSGFTSRCANLADRDETTLPLTCDCGFCILLGGLFTRPTFHNPDLSKTHSLTKLTLAPNKDH